MSNKKNVYISADYDEKSGDREVADLLNIWGKDEKHKVCFVDTAKVAKGSVSKDLDCSEYSRAAEPPVQCGVSHLSRRTEPHCL